MDVLTVSYSDFREIQEATTEYNKTHQGPVTSTTRANVFGKAMNQAASAKVKKMPALISPPLQRKRNGSSSKAPTGWDKNFIL